MNFLPYKTSLIRYKKIEMIYFVDNVTIRRNRVTQFDVEQFLSRIVLLLTRKGTKNIKRELFLTGPFGSFETFIISQTILSQMKYF